MTIEEAKRNLIKMYMEEIKKINEETEKSLEKTNFYNKAWQKELNKINKLREEREYILTQLDYINK